MVNNYTSIDDLIKKNQEAQMVSKPVEVEPVPPRDEISQVMEVVEHQPEKEVKLYIQTKPETIEIEPELKNLGLQPVSDIKFTNYQNVQIPISDDKVLAGLHQPITSSLRWLATLALYILQMAHLGLRKVGNKVIRVVKL